jgi:hypothetical protein
MKETARLICVVVIVMALMTAFSGVAFASRNVPSTPETGTLTITTEIVCDRKVNVRVRNYLIDRGNGNGEDENCGGR